MIPLVILALLCGLPLVLTLLFRANGGIVILALCAGSVLQQYVGKDAGTLLNSTSANSSSTMSAIAQLVLLFLPTLLTIIFLRRGVTASKLPFNILPAIGAGVLAVILAVPLLPGGVQHNIVTLPWWSSVEQLQGAAVTAVMVVGFITLWMLRPKHDKGKKHK
jgi:hypothetical protein